MKKETKIINLGRDPEQQKGAVNPPIYSTSTVVFPTLEQYLAAEKGRNIYDETGGNEVTDYSYGISGTPTTVALEEFINELEGGEQTWIVPSGLSSITTSLLSVVKSGDHILIVDTVYGPTRRFCNKVLKDLGVETEYYDPKIGSGIEELIRDNTSVIFLESPGSLTFEMQDVPAITKVAKSKDIVTILDNSWATPYNYRPLEHGVDIVLHAITKYISGHADILLGSITSNEKYRKQIAKTFRNLGVSVNPYACYLALRGARTLEVRLKKHQESALKVANWLQKHDLVEDVLYPALESDPGHEIWKRDFDGANGLLSFILKKSYDIKEISKLTDNLKLFCIGASWGGFESLVMPIDLKFTRSVTKWDKEGTAVRLHIGLEDPDDLIQDLETGLKKLS